MTQSFNKAIGGGNLKKKTPFGQNGVFNNWGG